MSSGKETFEGCAIHFLTTSARYIQLIDQTVHVINNSSACIELVFASNLNIIFFSGVELFLFDKGHHNLIFGELNFMIPLPPTYKTQMWDYKKTNIDSIWHSISSVDWKFLFQGITVHQKFMLFNKHLINIFHYFIPNNIIKCSCKCPLDDK